MFAAVNAKPAVVRVLPYIPAVIALGALASHLLYPMLTKPLRVDAQPLTVVTGWGGSGIAAWLIYAATMSAAGLCYLAAIRKARRRTIVRGALVATVFASLIAAFAFRFAFSSDAYAYAAYGALAASGENPYVPHTFPPAQVANAQWTSAIGFEWPSLPACVYGPLFIELARSIVLLTHFDLPQTIVALRLMEIVAFSAAIALIPDALVAAIVGLNPVVLTTVAEGHNDALLLLVLVAAYLLAQKRRTAGGLLAGLSALLKATGGVVALGLAAAFGSRRFFWSTVVGIAIAVLVQLAVTRLAGGYRPWVATDFVGTPEAAIAIAMRGVIALVFVLWALHCTGRGERVRALAAVTMAVWALYPNDYPWYGVWLLPLAALTLDEPEGPALLALTFSSVLRYLSDVYGFAPAAPWLEVVVVAVPLFVLAWRTRSTEKLLPA